MTIVKIEWQNNKKSLLVWSISLMLIILTFMAIFPSMANSGMKEMMTTKLDTLPENMLKAFHLNTGPSLVETTGFFAYVFQYLFIAASLFAVMFGSKMLVKEETEGTIEFLYAQPVSRRRIVCEKVAASISMLACFWLLTYMASLGASLFFNDGTMKNEEIISSLSKILFTEFFVLLFFLSLGFLLSSLLKRINQGVSMGTVFVLYLLGIIGDLEEKLSLLKDLSPIAQANPAVILEKDLDIQLILVLTGVSIILLASTLFIYERKDLEV
ncbi:ABC transporter permease subunit [Vagococcus fluvialis]|uniref:ABC transporter permease subunit n=1 Tax=Vagococcus fluvialis TaxID=2738 RepID=UPI003B5B761E